MRFYREYIAKNLRLKILSVILASMFWFAVSYMGESKMSLSVRVSVDKPGPEYMIRKLEPDEVFVTISGPVSILKQIRARDIRLILNLSDIKEGRHVFNIGKQDVQVPKGIHVETVKPDYAIIEVDRVIEKRLRTVVRLADRWSTRYRIKSWYPHYVTVEGPRGSLEKLNTLDTLPADGSFRNEEEVLYVGLATKDLVVRSVKPDAIRVVIRRY